MNNYSRSGRCLLGLLASALFLQSCATDHPRYERMSEEELLAYNMQQPLHEQIVCREIRHTSSRIPKRQCSTVLDILTQKEDVTAQLGVMNTSMPDGTNQRRR